MQMDKGLGAKDDLIDTGVSNSLASKYPNQVKPIPFPVWFLMVGKKSIEPLVSFRKFQGGYRPSRVKTGHRLYKSNPASARIPHDLKTDGPVFLQLPAYDLTRTSSAAAQ